MSKSTLSSVVSSLVRASVGISVPSTVPDEDLDKHVADLILKEAKQKAESYSRLGIKAYLPAAPDPNAPRPNKRFLSSIIRSTDDHNKTILRAQAHAAQEIKGQREEQERKERRARAEEATAAERSRRRRRRDAYDSDDWDTRRARDRGRSFGAWDNDWREHDPSEDEHDREREHQRSRRRHRSQPGSPDDERERERRHKSRHKRTSSRERDRERDPGRHERSRRKRERQESRDSDRHHKRRRQTDRPLHPEQSENVVSRKRSRSAPSLENRDVQREKPPREHAPHRISTPSRSSQTPVEDDRIDIDTESRHASKGKEKDADDVLPPVSPPRVRPPSPLPPPPPRRSRGRPTSSTSVRSPSISPPPLPPAALPSKMDKYFEDSYDPRLDVAPLSVPTVPKTGFINDSEYEAWDAMLELLRQRREDKEEKKRLEKLGFNTSDKKIPTSKPNKYNEGGDTIMEIEYKKKGSVREWDLGKEGF